jgi:hypothetical protein
MLTEEFKKQRALTVRELTEKALDPFIKMRNPQSRGAFSTWRPDMRAHRSHSADAH